MRPAGQLAAGGCWGFVIWVDHTSREGSDLLKAWHVYLGIVFHTLAIDQTAIVSCNGQR